MQPPINQLLLEKMLKAIRSDTRIEKKSLSCCQNAPNLFCLHCFGVKNYSVLPTENSGHLGMRTKFPSE